MKALIAAGGRSTRMRPITHTINKHLIPLANRPMLEYVIEKLVDADIRDIVINVNPGERDTMRAAFGDGERWDAKIAYVEQEGGPKGLAHVVANAEQHLKGGPFVFFLGDNVMAGSIHKMKERYESESFDCMVALSRVKDPRRFGVPEFNPDGTLRRAVEKPQDPPSPFAITGIYFFNERYFDAFKTISPSARGEYEITDMITWYIENGRVGHEEITGWWKDTGTPDALLEGNALLLDEMAEDVRIDPTARIGDDVKINAPVAIGANCVITDAVIGPYASIGNNVTIEHASIERAIVMDGAKINAGSRIVDSILGRNVTVTGERESTPRNHKLIIGDHAVVEL